MASAGHVHVVADELLLLVIERRTYSDRLTGVVIENHVHSFPSLQLLSAVIGSYVGLGPNLLRIIRSHRSLVFFLRGLVVV